MHPAYELREGLGPRLPAAEHQGDALLDRDPPASRPAAAGRGAPHHAHRRPTAPRLILLPTQNKQTKTDKQTNT